MLSFTAHGLFVNCGMESALAVYWPVIAQAYTSEDNDQMLSHNLVW